MVRSNTSEEQYSARMNLTYGGETEPCMTAEVVARSMSFASLERVQDWRYRFVVLNTASRYTFIKSTNC